LGIGDWGLGIGPNHQSPIPNPQSPINKREIHINYKGPRIIRNHITRFIPKIFLTKKAEIIKF